MMANNGHPRTEAMTQTGLVGHLDFFIFPSFLLIYSIAREEEEDEERGILYNLYSILTTFKKIYLIFTG